MVRNQIRVIGPKKAAIRWVPRACKRKRATSRPAAMGTTYWRREWPISGAPFTPSTADRTEIAGVSTLSP